jgi:two-component system response regulator DevR
VITVFLVDDHEVVRRGVADLLAADEEITVTGEAATAAQAMARIPALRPDLALLDVRLPDGNGVELCRDLRSRLPELNVLILTSYTDEEAMLDAILAGAGGYVIKDIQGLQLISAVREVGCGRSLLDNRAAATLMAKLRSDASDGSPLASLTERERTLLDLIGDGLTNRQIAERMYLAEKTVKNYVSRLLTKLGLQRRTQAAVLATRVREKQWQRRNLES